MRFSSTMMSYGYFGDLMARSEARRWLGPSRYDVCGAQTWAAGRAYRGAVGYVEVVNPARPDDHPSQRRLCTSDCEGRFASGFSCIATPCLTSQVNSQTTSALSVIYPEEKNSDINS